jgi:tRNA threonylcarbamoyladenosine biosynthesis protein TsaE
LKELRCWKKVLEKDLDSIVLELSDFIDGRSVIILSGEVGVGKTTFTKAFASSQTNREINVSSPTYSIVNEFGHILHADFYRLKGPEELIHLELPLYIEEKEILFIEWGLPYLEHLKEIVDEDFFFYELLIEINPNNNEKEAPTRNLFFRALN